MARIAYRAPSMNLVMSTTTKTVPDMTAPTALMTRERFMRERTFASVSVRSERFQCRIMPLWLSVKETKTPTI